MSAQKSTDLHFEPPKSGYWELDSVHFPRPSTRYWTEVHPASFLRGTAEFALRLPLGEGLPAPHYASAGAAGLDLLLADPGVLEQVVEEPGGDRHLVEVHLREDAGDLERVDQVRLAGDAHLPAVRPRGVDVGAPQQILVAVRVVGRDQFEDVLEAE